MGLSLSKENVLVSPYRTEPTIGLSKENVPIIPFVNSTTFSIFTEMEGIKVKGNPTVRYNDPNYERLSASLSVLGFVTEQHWVETTDGW